MSKYNWAIVGTGVIAGAMAEVLREINGEIYAVGSRRPESAEKFAGDYEVRKVYGDCAAMLADPEVDIVYIATPHNLHYEYIMNALRAGKHVLSEKAITVNAVQAREAAAFAKERGLVLMEGMTIYHMPLFKELRRIVDSGAIGRVKMIQVNFGSCKAYDVNNRFFSKELAGGALLDIGVYASAFARFFMEERHETVLTTANYFETGVDEQSGIIVKNGRGQMAVMALTMRAKQPKRGVVAGERGYIEVANYPRADKAVITYTEDGRAEEICLGDSAKALHYEVEDMQACVEEGVCDQTLQYSVEVMELLSDVRNQWGFVYPFE